MVGYYFDRGVLIEVDADRPVAVIRPTCDSGSRIAASRTRRGDGHPAVLTDGGCGGSGLVAVPRALGSTAKGRRPGEAGRTEALASTAPGGLA